MIFRVVWPEPLWDVLQELPARERNLILSKVDYLETFPRMYSIRTHGRFRGHRWFPAGNWLVFYRLVGEEVFMRAIWPARIP